MPDTWPYGNDLKRPKDWAGKATTLSRRYNIAYISGTRFGLYSHHTFLFYAYEAMSIGIFTFKTLGIHAAIQRKRRWRIFDEDRMRIKPISDVSEKAKSIKDTVEEMQWEDIMTMTDQYAKAKILHDIVAHEGIPMRAKQPFSLDDLRGRKGSMSGAELEFIAKFSFYAISADDKFENIMIPNLSWGFRGGSVDQSAWRIWILEDQIDLYSILPVPLDIYDSTSPHYNMRPYFRYHTLDYFRHLPPLSAPVPIAEHILLSAEFYRKMEMGIK